LHRISPSKMVAWLTVALIGPVLSVIGKSGWGGALLAVGLCSVIALCRFQFDNEKLPRWLCVLEFVWLAVFLAGAAPQSGYCWSDASANMIIPIVLIALAAVSSQKGSVPSARVGATLLWLVFPVLGIVAVAGATDVDLSLVRRELTTPDGMLLGLLLIPCMGLLMPQNKPKKAFWAIPVIGAVAVIMAILLDSVMGFSVAQEAGDTFYEFSKGVNLFGVAERFEALVACVLTAEWFVLFSLILSTSHHLWERISTKGIAWSVWLCSAMSVLLMCNLHIPGQLLGVGCLIFWGFLPLLTQGLGVAKKVIKKQK